MVSYQTILEALVRAIVARDVSQYQQSDSDSWTHARTLGPGDRDWKHLEFRIHLGGATTQRQARCLAHEGCYIEFMHRDKPDGNSSNHGRMLDAARDLLELLATWGMAGVGVRTVPEGYRITDTDGEYAKIRVHFHLQITDWRA